MARPSKTAAPDTTQAIELTAGAIERLTCRTDTKAQVFLRDTKAPGLRVRASNTGHKSFVFEAKLNRQTIRRTIGDVRAWTIEQARTEARRLAVLIDEGVNPSELEREQQAQHEAQRQQQEAQAVTVGDAWAAYIEARRPHWGALHLRDNVGMMAPGGEPKKRGKGTTEPGPLAQFASMRLADVTPEAVQAWADTEAQRRPTRARLGLHLFHAFVNWCSEQPDYAAAVPEKNPARSRRAREALGKPQAKHDALMKEQLAAWFGAVQTLRSAAASAYLQCLLLTGARPGELVALRWDDVNTQWRGLTLRDKDESKGGRDGQRVIPLTPYVHHLLASLPRRSEWVFSSDTKPQPISRPHRRLADVCAVAGIEGLTLHGLRRSFGSLSEWLELPAGVVAQIQGHKPSATAEKHYRVRPLDLLRVHHEKLEAWILEQAGVQFDASKEPGKLHAVKS
ncbi:MAG: integrase family protein [Comamonadaceae bacterium]|nr:integrase family protein [Burkholderiales bacterium]MEB2347599.1 integrase family protein [Comamonadaceae bacterium]